MKLKHLIATLVCSIALIGCAEQILNPTVSVSVSGVNYTDKGILYRLQDPLHPENSAGGEGVGAYGAGGIMCCYALPAKWRPGIQVKVVVYDDHRILVKEVLAEVPPYVKGVPGQLWAAVYPDGNVEAISSDASPQHPDWPGKVKGWPVPSMAHQRKLWQEHLDREKISQIRFEQASKDPQWTHEERERYLKLAKELAQEILIMEKNKP